MTAELAVRRSDALQAWWPQGAPAEQYRSGYRPRRYLEPGPGALASTFWTYLPWAAATVGARVVRTDAWTEPLFPGGYEVPEIPGLEEGAA